MTTLIDDAWELANQEPDWITEATPKTETKSEPEKESEEKEEPKTPDLDSAIDTAMSEPPKWVQDSQSQKGGFVNAVKRGTVNIASDVASLGAAAADLPEAIGKVADKYKDATTGTVNPLMAMKEILTQNVEGNKVSRAMLDTSKKLSDYAEKNFPREFKSYKDIENASDFGRWLVEQAGEQAPQLVTGLAGGMAVKAGKLGKMAQLMAYTLPTAGDVGGGAYQQMDEGGAKSPGLALTAGAGGAALEAIPGANMMSKLGILSDFKKQMAKNAADPLFRKILRIGGNTIKQGTEESLTEMPQEALSVLAVYTADKDKDVFGQQFKDEVLPRMKEAGVAAFATGGLFGGMAGVHAETRGTVVNQIERRKQINAAMESPESMQAFLDQNPSAKIFGDLQFQLKDPTRKDFEQAMGRGVWLSQKERSAFAAKAREVMLQQPEKQAEIQDLANTEANQDGNEMSDLPPMDETKQEQPEQEAPPPVDEFSRGETVTDAKGRTLTITDTSDPSLLTVRAKEGTEFQVGRKAVTKQIETPVSENQPEIPDQKKSETITPSSDATPDVRRKALTDMQAMEIPEDRNITIPENSKIRDIAKQVIPWAKNNGVVGTHTNEWDGVPIRVTSEKIKNAISHGAGPQKAKLIGILPEMLKKAVPIDTRTNYKNPDLTDHTYGIKVKIDGQDYMVGIMTHEDQNGRRFYDHELTEMKKLDVSDSDQRSRTITGGQSEKTRQASIISILDDFIKSKSENIPTEESSEGQGELNTQPTEKNEVTETSKDNADTTSIKNAAVDDLRSKRGESPISGESPESQQKWMDQAEEKIKADPTLPDRLVRELNEKPRNMEPDEVAAMQIHYRRLNNAFAEASDRLFKAQESDNVEEATKAQTDTDLILSQMQETENAARSAGRTWGRSGVARQIELLNDFSMSNLSRRARAAKSGKPLMADENRKIKELSDKVTDLQKRLEDHLAEQDKAARQNDVDREIDIAKKAKKPIKIVRKAAAQKAVSDAWKEFETKAAGKLFSNPIDPELVVSAAKIVKAYIDLGVVSFSEFMANARSQFGDKAVKARETFAEAWKQLKEQGEIPTFDIDSDDASSISRMAKKLTRSVVESGITDRDAVVDTVHSELKEAIPEITRRQTIDAISGYGQYRELTKDEISQKVRDINGQLQQLAKLDDMQKGKAPSKTGVERREPSDEERRLIAQVNEAKKRGGFTVTDPSKQLKSSLDSAKTAIRNRIVDLEKEIATREKIVKERTPLQPDTELTALRQKRDQLQAEHDKLFPKQPLTPEQENERYRKILQKRLADYQQRIKTSDFAKPEVKPKPYDKETLNLKYQLEQTKAKFKTMEEMWKRQQQTMFQKAVRLVPEALNTFRAIMTSMDLSAVFRQGGVSAFSHPILTVKAFPAMLKAAMSKKGEYAMMEEIRNRPNAQLYKQAKLAITEAEGRLSKQEEAYMGQWSKFIPGVAASERAYVTFLNRIRADVFDSMVSTLGRGGKVSLDQAKVIANFVNVSTGRGSLGKAEAAAVPLATVFFAPRYVLSRFQLILGQPMWRGDTKTRLLIASEYARTLAGIGLFYGIMSLAGSLYDDDDRNKPKFEWDPRSSDFGKIRFGDTRLDPLMGLSQTTVLLTKLTTGEVKNALGDIVPIRGDKVKFGGTTTPDVIARFLRTKLSPAIGNAIDLLSGKDVVGESVTLTSLAKESIMPLSFGDIYKAMQAQGVPKGAALSMLTFFGMGLQTYQSKDASPDYHADLIYKATSEPAKREKGETLDHYQQRQAKRKETIQRAKAVIKEYKYTSDDISKYFRDEAAKKKTDRQISKNGKLTAYGRRKERLSYLLENR
jgi:hypothetical protein